MKNVARRHHFVPQGYLAGFTNDGTRAGLLTVFDRVSQSIFLAKPRNVAAKRDFNRVDLEGRPPDYLEQAMGEFEGKAISATPTHGSIWKIMTGYFLQPGFPFCLPGRRQAYTRPPLAVKGPLRRFAPWTGPIRETRCL